MYDLRTRRRRLSAESPGSLDMFETNLSHRLTRNLQSSTDSVRQVLRQHRANGVVKLGYRVVHRVL